MSRVFVSHSSSNKAFARTLVEALSQPEVHPWIDEKEILVGEDILDGLGEGLRQMDVLVFLISKDALESEWLNREVKFAAKREIVERRVMIMPFIVDDTPVDALPWFLQHRNVARIPANSEGARLAAHGILTSLQRRSDVKPTPSAQEMSHPRDPRIDKLIEGINPGDWTKAQRAALAILEGTDRSGRNQLFDILAAYIHHCTEDEQFGVLNTLESIAQLAPCLVGRELLVDMANNSDFSVRSSAASICFDLAELAPDRVPVDVAIKLARHDEDWYVTTPATAALKMMAKWRPGIVQLFYSWLTGQDDDEREHALGAITDIANQEPEILDADDLALVLKHLTEIGDQSLANRVREIIPNVRKAADTYPHRYGRF